MSTEPVSIDIVADIKRYAKQLDQINGLTRKEALKTATFLAKRDARDHARRVRLAEREARKHALAQRTAADKAREAWDNALKINVTDRLLDVGQAVGSALLDMGRAALETQDQIIRLTKQTDIAAVTLEAIATAGRRNGVAFKDLSSNIQDFSERMFDFTQGGGEAEETFSSLGVQVRDVNGDFRDTNSVFIETIDKLSRMEDQTMKTALANQILGDGGLDIIAAFENTAGIEEFIRHAERFGLEVGPAAIKATDDWNKSFATLQESINQVSSKMLATFGGEGTREFFDNVVKGSTLTVNTLSELASIAKSHPLTKLDLFHFYQNSGDAIRKAREETEAFFASQDRLGESPIDQTPTEVGETLVEKERREKAEADAAKRAVKMVKDREAAMARLESITRAMTLVTLDGEERIRENYRQRIEDLDEIAQKVGQTAELEAARLATQAAMEAELHRFRLDRAEELAAQQERLRKQAEREQQRIQNGENKANRDDLQAKLASAEAIHDIVKSTSTLIFGEMDARTKKAKAAKISLLIFEKAAAAALIGYNLAVGLSSAAARPGPLALAALAQVAALGASARSQMKAIQIPKFHSGRFLPSNAVSGIAPDEIVANVKRKEVIVDEDTVANNGGPSGVRRALAGGGQQTPPMLLQLRDETIELMADYIQTRTASTSVGMN